MSGEARTRTWIAPSYIQLGWLEQAACAGADPDEWHPAKGNTVANAKRVCQRCPVIAECLEYALATDQEHGVWGGLSVRARRKLARERDAA